MSESTEATKELDSLLTNLFDIGLTDHESGRLEAILKSDASARAKYLKYVSLHAHLQWRAGMVGRQHSAPVLKALNDAVMMPALADEGGMWDESEEARRFPPREKMSAWRIYSRRIIGLAAGVLIAGSMAAWHFGWTKPNRNLTAGTGSSQQVLATISASAGGVWDGGALCAVGTHLEKGQVHSLTHGWLEISLSKGASVLVEAPAEFSVGSADQLLLTRGRVAASVPVEARGFTVQTPKLAVMDLGTEFSTICNAKETKVSVFRGRVVATSLDASSNAKPVLLTEKQSGALSGNVFEPLPAGTLLDAGVRRIGSAGLPGGWEAADVGSPAVPGSAVYDVDQNTWTISGGGEDIFFKNDQLHLASLSTSGNVEIEAELPQQPADSTQPITTNAKRGIELRDSRDPSSSHVTVTVTEGRGVQMITRNHKGEITKILGNDQIPIHFPCWLKLSRTGQTCRGYYSTDGVKWQMIDSCEPGFTTDQILAGLVACSYNPKTAIIGTFTNVSVIAHP